MRAFIKLTAIAIVFLAAQAQAQTICSGAGIHQSCVSKPGAYNKGNGATTPLNGTNARTVDRWYHKTGNATHNQGNFGTQLNTARRTNQNLQATQK